MRPLLITLLLLTFPAQAEMYKWVDEEGNISYSDQPPIKGAKKLTPPELTTTPAVDIPKKTQKAEAEDEKDKDTKYSYLKIITPESDATIRNNTGSFSLTANLKPALNTSQGHYLSFYLDGKIVHDKQQSSSASFNNVDRGSHSLQVHIKNKQGKTLKSSPAIMVHLHRHSVLRKKAQP